MAGRRKKNMLHLGPLPARAAIGAKLPAADFLLRLRHAAIDLDSAALRCSEAERERAIVFSAKADGLRDAYRIVAEMLKEQELRERALRREAPRSTTSKP